jgi:hypothetical protein
VTGSLHVAVYVAYEAPRLSEAPLSRFLIRGPPDLA